MSDDKNIKKIADREFKLTTAALKNRNTVYVLLFVIVVFGLFTYRNLPKELFPEIVWPQIMVQTTYLGNSPEDMENIITRPLEKELESVKGVKKISSVSAQDASMITVEFTTDVDMEEAKRRVKDAIDMAESELPQNDQDLIGPIVFDLDLSEIPIININLSGEYSIEEIKEYAEFLEDELEEINEVSKVDVQGINEKEVKIKVDLIKLEAVELGFNDVIGAIESENKSMSVGEIKLGGTRRNIRIKGEIEDPKELEKLIVKTKEGNIVYLKDVADVEFGYAEPNSFARLNKNPVISIQVIKKGGENILATTEKIFDVLDKAREENMLPADLNITLTDDQSEQVEMQIDNLENSMILGIIFVVAVLFFFLGTRNALFVGLAIPLSMFLSFVIIGIIDFRINMIVLFALILALGMLVDNAIVVVENIYRFVDEGYKPLEAARQAVGEIAIPIIASTATTLAAFFPLAMWQGIMGEFMKYLPITLIIVLSSSLFVALVIIPVISATFIGKSEKKVQTTNTKRRGITVASVIIIFGIILLFAKVMVLGNLLILFGLLGILYHTVLYRTESWFQDIFLVRLENYYLKVLSYALHRKRPLWFLLGTFGLLIGTIMFFGASNPKVLFFPENDPNYINIVCELPIGTDIEKTNQKMYEIENDVYKFLEPYINDSIVESVLTTVGKGDPTQISSEALPHKAITFIQFVDFELRNGIRTSNIMRMLSDSLSDRYPGIEIEIMKEQNGPPAGKPINIEITGQDFNKLIELADTFETIIDNSDIEGIEGLKLNVNTAKPELSVTIDRDKATRSGLNTSMVAFALRQALFGFEASELKIGEDDYPINVRLKDKYRYNISTLENLKIQAFDSDGNTVYIPASTVANFEYTTSVSSVRRIDLDRAITIYSNVVEGFNATEVNDNIKALLANFEMPEGYNYNFTGEQEEQEESMAFLMQAFLIAIALVLIILVSQFNSVVRPLIILASIIFSTIGVFGGLATFQMEFVVMMTGIGIISLAGIVVNNAIVLIDYIELLKERKRKELGLEPGAFLPIDAATECIVLGGKTRLRPVLLTAITTILGLLPMAVGLNIDFAGLFNSYEPNIYFGGDNAAFWSPMSWTVIFGLTFSTFLTLVIVPVMYRLTTLAQKSLLQLSNNLKIKKNGEVKPATEN